jgi:pyruvate dehydrogenase E2 component (dihydrolipoamide acetyltransferase)
MAQLEFKLPDIGEGVTEGEIVEWHVSSGDRVDEDDPMVEVMTDKATVTIGAPKPGVIQEVRYDVGATAQVGEVIVVMDTEAGEQASAEQPASANGDGGSSQPEPSGATAVGDIREGVPGSNYFSGERAAASRSDNGAGAATPTPAAAPPSQGTAAGGGLQTVQDDYYAEKPLATPATRKLARDLNIDLRKVRPSGSGGRVLKDDVLAHAQGPSSGAAQTETEAQSAQPQRAPASGAAREPVRIQAPTAEHGALEQRKPFVGIRRKIAERMQTAKNTAAHFTFVEECDVGRLKELRQRLKPQAEAQDVKLTFLPFIVKATVAALKKHPVLNSALDESTSELVYRNYYHIGIATQTDQGLMVPVVRDADRRSVIDVAQEIARLSEGARNGTLTSPELTGSTFTITSLGKQGGLFATPVLNFPEVGILGVHQMKQKPVVRDGEIVVGDVMLLSLSFDHRIVDGHVGAEFAYDIIGYLEDPDRLFLEMS